MPWAKQLVGNVGKSLSRGMVDKDGEGDNETRKGTTRKERVRFHINRINQYSDFARTTKEVVSHLGRNAVTLWPTGIGG